MLLQPKQFIIYRQSKLKVTNVTPYVFVGIFLQYIYSNNKMCKMYTFTTSVSPAACLSPVGLVIYGLSSSDYYDLLLYLHITQNKIKLI